MPTDVVLSALAIAGLWDGDHAGWTPAIVHATRCVAPAAHPAATLTWTLIESARMGETVNELGSTATSGLRQSVATSAMQADCARTQNHRSVRRVRARTRMRGCACCTDGPVHEPEAVAQMPPVMQVREGWMPFAGSEPDGQVPFALTNCATFGQKMPSLSVSDAQ